MRARMRPRVGNRIAGFNKRIFTKMKERLLPDLKFSQLVYEEFLDEYVGANIRILDLGCGHRILPEWRLDAELQLVKRADMFVGLDADYLSIRRHRSLRYRVNGDIGELPFRSNSFDMVIANMVFEHLVDPQIQIGEMCRVLRDKGIILFHTPNIESYGPRLGRLIPDVLKKKLIAILEGRQEVDFYPTYYRVNSADRIKELARRFNCSVVECKLILSYPVFIQFPPMLLLELFVLMQLNKEEYAKYRPNIIAVLRKHGN